MVDFYGFHVGKYTIVSWMLWDPGSLSENGFMEPKYWTMPFGVDSTPQSSAETMTIDADRELVTSWWFFTIHLKHMRKSLDHFPTNRGEHLKKLKPPPR